MKQQITTEPHYNLKKKITTKRLFYWIILFYKEKRVDTESCSGLNGSSVADVFIYIFVHKTVWLHNIINGVLFFRTVFR